MKHTWTVRFNEALADPTLRRARTYLKFGLLLLLLAGTPLLAQQPTFDNNVIVRAVWWLTKAALYGVGATVTLWGVMLPVTKKVFSQGRHQEQSVVSTVLIGVSILAAPSILQLGIDWFNNDRDASGQLDDLYLDFGSEP